MFPHIQMIDMLPEGRIDAHCDNAKMFGAFTCGLNLSSSAVALRSAFVCGPAFQLQLVRFPISQPSELTLREILLPAQVMRFEQTKGHRHPDGSQRAYYDCFLPRRSCYLMSKDARWNYTHGVLASQADSSLGIHVSARWVTY